MQKMRYANSSDIIPNWNDIRTSSDMEGLGERSQRGNINETRFC